MFGNLAYYEVVVEAVDHRLCKRTATLVVHYYIEIVGRKCAYLAGYLVGERVGVLFHGALCGGLGNFRFLLGCKLFGDALGECIVIHLGGGVNFHGLSLVTLADHNLRNDYLLGNLGSYVIG